MRASVKSAFWYLQLNNKHVCANWMWYSEDDIIALAFISNEEKLWTTNNEIQPQMLSMMCEKPASFPM